MLKKLYKWWYKDKYNTKVRIACEKSKFEVNNRLSRLLSQLNIKTIVYRDRLYIDYEKAYIIVDFKLYSEDCDCNEYDWNIDADEVIDIILSNNKHKKRAFNKIFKKRCYYD